MIIRFRLLVGAVVPIVLATAMILLWWAAVAALPLSVESTLRVTSLGALAGAAAVGLAAWMYRWASRLCEKINRLQALVASSQSAQTVMTTTSCEPRDELDAVTEALSDMQDVTRRHAELARAFDHLRTTSQQSEEVAQQLRHNEVRVADCLERLQRAERAMTYRTRAAAVGELFAGVCHDVNEQLEFLLASPDTAQAAARMTEVARDLQRRMRLYVRLSARRPFHLTAFQLLELLDEAVLATEPRWKSQALINGVVFRMAVSCPPHLMVRMDRTDLMEMLVHLVDNAVDAMPLGGTIALEAASSDRDTAMLVVRDPGTGMSDATLHGACEPFFSTREDAAGMGLAVVSALARRNNIRFGLRSARGQGTTAMIQMPVAREAAGKAEESMPLPELPLRPLLILAVDDNARTTEMIRDLLDRDGHVVDPCNDPAQALELLAKRSYDAVLIDRAMPGMGGFELARAIKKNHAQLPVIMITGFADVMRQNGETVREIDALLGKPFSRDELVTALAAVTNSRALRPS